LGFVDATLCACELDVSASPARVASLETELTPSANLRAELGAGNSTERATDHSSNCSAHQLPDHWSTLLDSIQPTIGSFANSFADFLDGFLHPLAKSELSLGS